MFGKRWARYIAQLCVVLPLSVSSSCLHCFDAEWVSNFSKAHRYIIAMKQGCRAEIKWNTVVGYYSHRRIAVAISEDCYILTMLLQSPTYRFSDSEDCYIFMASLYNRASHCIFVLWFLLLSCSFFLSFFPRLISAVADWMSTILPRWALAHILHCISQKPSHLYNLL